MRGRDKRSIMTRGGFVAALVSCALTLGAAPGHPQASDREAQAGPSYVYYAGMPARLTMDRDSEGGNPFASALVSVLGGAGLTLANFGHRMAAATFKSSGGWQSPDIPRTRPSVDWAFAPAEGERRVALVLINADYRVAGVPSLAGALFDSARVTEALRRAGFETTLLLDQGPDAVRSSVAEFSDRSAEADVALVYLGGHGVQHRRTVYLLSGDYPDPRRADHLETHAYAVPDLARASRARRVNLVLYAACRDDPFL
ncbi:hypothetical protein GC169_03745 [bacterium]|nr:hypothetical protein [bacterium]